jgi:Ca2+/Na+ antiporter
MRTIARILLGVCSSLLLAAGFARAADRLDPMNDGLRASAPSAITSAPDCTTSYCNIAAPDCTTSYCNIAAPDCTTSYCNIADDAN